MDPKPTTGRNWPFSLRITDEERRLLRERSRRLKIPAAAIARRGLDAELADERRVRRPARPTPAGETSDTTPG